jgi:Uma2 family endonuclease
MHRGGLRRQTALNPVLIVEVLSDGTENYDRGRKFKLYRQIESFPEYLVIAQDRVYIEHHRRDESIHTQWTVRVFTSGDDVICLSAIPAQLRVADIYRKVPVGASREPRA